MSAVYIQVCPPGLHIALGVFLKHFTSLEAACHQLDVKAASLPRKTSIPALEAAARRHQLVLERQEKEEEYKDLLDQHMYMSVLYPQSQPTAMLLETAEEKKKEILKLVISVHTLAVIIYMSSNKRWYGI